MTAAVAVIDASALVKLALPEEYSNVMRRIITEHDDARLRLIAPDLIFTECANVLWKHTRRGNSAISEAVSALQALRGHNIALVPQGELVEAALDFALTYGSSVYDALYCALAQRDGAVLITADERLVNRVAGSGVRAFTLPAWAERAGW